MKKISTLVAITVILTSLMWGCKGGTMIDKLADARKTKISVERPTKSKPEMTAEEAYKLQGELVGKLVRRYDETVIGYKVINMVTAKIRDIDEVGTIIDAVAKAGGDLTRVDSVSFSVDDPSDYYEEAREKAMAEAKAKAKQLASLADVTLGKPTYISEGVQAPPIYQRGVVYEEAMMAVPKAASISPGETEINLTVQVVYAILN